MPSLKKSSKRRLRRTKTRRNRRRRTQRTKTNQTRKRRRGGGPAISTLDKSQDDVAVILITTHGSIIPTVTKKDGVEYLDGRPLLNNLRDITLYKINAVSPGVCNYIQAIALLVYVNVISSLFGYHYEINPETNKPIMKRGNIDDINFAQDMYDDTSKIENFIMNAEFILDVFKENRNVKYTMQSTKPEDQNYLKIFQDNKEHSYKKYIIQEDTPMFNKKFSVSASEHTKAQPYDWDITMFDSGGSMGLLDNMILTNSVKMELNKDEIDYSIDTVSMVNYIYNNFGKRRIIMLDMTCSVLPSSSEIGTTELTTHTPAGRAGIRATRETAHG